MMRRGIRGQPTQAFLSFICTAARERRLAIELAQLFNQFTLYSIHISISRETMHLVLRKVSRSMTQADTVGTGSEESQSAATGSADVTPVTAPSTAGSLGRLPLELFYKVLGELDQESTLTLRRTAKSLRWIVPFSIRISAATFNQNREGMTKIPKYQQLGAYWQSFLPLYSGAASSGAKASAQRGKNGTSSGCHARDVDIIVRQDDQAHDVMRLVSSHTPPTARPISTSQMTFDVSSSAMDTAARALCMQELQCVNAIIRCPNQRLSDLGTAIKTSMRYFASDDNKWVDTSHKVKVVELNVRAGAQYTASRLSKAISAKPAPNAQPHDNAWFRLEFDTPTFVITLPDLPDIEAGTSVDTAWRGLRNALVNALPVAGDSPVVVAASKASEATMRSMQALHKSVEENRAPFDVDPWTYMLASEAKSDRDLIPRSRLYVVSTADLPKVLPLLDVDSTCRQRINYDGTLLHEGQSFPTYAGSADCQSGGVTEAKT